MGKAEYWTECGERGREREKVEQGKERKTGMFSGAS